MLHADLQPLLSLTATQVLVSTAIELRDAIVSSGQDLHRPMNLVR